MSVFRPILVCCQVYTFPRKTMRKSTKNILLIISSTLATWCEEVTDWGRPWCWERLKAGGEGDDRGWDGWIASLTQWAWVWVNSRSWWWTGKPGVLQSMGSQRVGHDWAELNWTEQKYTFFFQKKQALCNILSFVLGICSSPIYILKFPFIRLRRW